MTRVGGGVAQGFDLVADVFKQSSHHSYHTSSCPAPPPDLDLHHHLASYKDTSLSPDIVKSGVAKGRNGRQAGPEYVAQRRLGPMAHDFDLPSTERIFVSPFVLANCCR